MARDSFCRLIDKKSIGDNGGGKGGEGKEGGSGKRRFPLAGKIDENGTGRKIAAEAETGFRFPLKSTVLGVTILADVTFAPNVAVHVAII